MEGLACLDKYPNAHRFKKKEKFFSIFFKVFFGRFSGCPDKNPNAHRLKRKESNSFDLTWFCAIVTEAGRGNVRERFLWSTTFCLKHKTYSLLISVKQPVPPVLVSLQCNALIQSYPKLKEESWCCYILMPSFFHPETGQGGRRDAHWQARKAQTLFGNTQKSWWRKAIELNKN